MAVMKKTYGIGCLMLVLLVAAGMIIEANRAPGEKAKRAAVRKQAEEKQAAENKADKEKHAAEREPHKSDRKRTWTLSRRG